MGSPADLAHLQSTLAAAGLSLPFSEHVQAADATRHLALLSRFPITARRPVTDLRYQLDQAEYPVQRGFLDLTIPLSPSFSVRFIGAHLKSRRDIPEADQALMRRNEAHLLRAHLDILLAADPLTPLLLYGDFNDTRDQPSIKAIKGLLSSTTVLHELLPTDPQGDRWTFHYPTADEYSRIDFLFASPGLYPQLADRTATLHRAPDWFTASDHRPLSTLIQIPTATPKPPASKSKTSPTPTEKAPTKRPPRPKKPTAP